MDEATATEFQRFSARLASEACSHRDRLNAEVKELHRLCSKPDTSTGVLYTQYSNVKMWMDFLQRAEMLLAQANFEMKEVRANAAVPATQTPSPPVIFTEGVLPPMSFQEAKVLLYPHSEREGYLEQALRELDAFETTKTIKQASAAHLRKAARDFAVRTSERKA